MLNEQLRIIYIDARITFLLLLGLSAFTSLYPFMYNLSSLGGIEEFNNVSKRQIIFNLCCMLQASSKDGFEILRVAILVIFHNKKKNYNKNYFFWTLD